MSRLIVAAALLTASLPAVAQGRAIERYANNGPGGSIILQSVAVPAGNDMLYLSGQVAAPIDKKAQTDEPQPADYGDTRTQTVSALTKIKAILESHGYTMHDVIKLTVFVVGDAAKGGKMDFKGMNEGFKSFFGTTDNPITVARSTVQVAALASPAFLVEIEATAAKAPGKSAPIVGKNATVPTKSDAAKSESGKTGATRASQKKTSATTP